MSRRSAFERRLRRELHAARPPRAGDAERRAWHVVRAAHAARGPGRVRRSRVRFAIAAAAAAMAAVALALTPAGAKVGDWFGDVVNPAPEATHSSLSSLPAPGRLLVVADGGAWVVREDGSRDRLGTFSDASWSPGGLHVVAARGNELVALDPDGTENWSRPGRGRVTVPRWSPGYGYRIAYRRGSDLHVAVGDNSADRLLWRGTDRTPPSWKPLPPAAEQAVAFADAGRVRVVAVDTGRVVGLTRAGPPAREIWWAERGTRLVAVTARSVRIHGERGHLLRSVRMPRGLTVAGSAMAPGGHRLAIVARAAPGRSSASRLLVLRLDRPAPPRLLFSTPGRFEGLTWSIDGRLLVMGRPQADQWLFVNPRGPAALESVKRIRDTFDGGRAPRTGAFPRPAGWCYATPDNRAGTGQPPCSAGSAP